MTRIVATSSLTCEMDREIGSISPALSSRRSYAVTLQEPGSEEQAFVTLEHQSHVSGVTSQPSTPTMLPRAESMHAANLRKGLLDDNFGSNINSIRTISVHAGDDGECVALPLHGDLKGCPYFACFLGDGFRMDTQLVVPSIWLQPLRQLIRLLYSMETCLVEQLFLHRTAVQMVLINHIALFFLFPSEFFDAFFQRVAIRRIKLQQSLVDGRFFPRSAEPYHFESLPLEHAIRWCVALHLPCDIFVDNLSKWLSETPEGALSALDLANALPPVDGVCVEDDRLVSAVRVSLLDSSA